MSRLLAIGDIHGQSAAFRALLEVIKPTRDDVLVLLGDYINRGPDSRGVIERILRLREETQLICLRGNHEQMLLDAHRSGDGGLFWIECGGDETLRSFGCDDVESMPDYVFDFLNETRLYYETEKFIFVHANVDAEVPMESQSANTLLWRHLEYAPAHCSGKVVICGHTPQASGLPVHFGSAVCIDTDVGRSGWLTCYEPLRGRYWQCNADGKRRADILLPEEE
jgi:serine/threonine protein phosphatase 1